MSTTTAPGTFTELYTDLLNRVREQTGITNTTVLAKRYINLANQWLYAGTAEKFPWAKRRGFITMHPQYTTGTVDVISGSTTVGSTGTLWTTVNAYGQANARAGGKIVIEGHDFVYQVVSITDLFGSLIMFINPAWIGDTDTGLTYTYFEDEYALASDFLRPYDLTSFDDAREIPLVGDQEFRRMFPRNKITGQHVRAATMLDLPPSGNTTPVRKVRFAPPPASVMHVPYTYVTSLTVTSSTGTAQAAFTADADEPIIPLRYRQMLVSHALYQWYRDRKDDARAREALAEFEAMKATTVEDQEAGQQRASVRPSSAPLARAKRPYSHKGRRGRRYDTGAFDRLLDGD